MHSSLTTEHPVKNVPVIRLKEALGSRLVMVTLIATFIALSVAYWPAFTFWWSKWFEKESYYSHGPFVPVASVFIIWFNRKKLAEAPVRPLKWGYLIVAFAVVTAWLAFMGASASVAGFTFPLFLLGAVIVVAGLPLAHELAFPISFLFFAAVLPESILIALSFKAQMLSVLAATAGLDVLGVQAVSRGAFIELSDVTVEIADACSGFRLAVSMLAIAVFFAYIRRGPVWGRLAIVAVALPLSLAVNSIRILAVTLIGQIYGESALRQAHDWTGFVILFAGAALLLLFTRVVKCGRYREMPLS